MEHGFVFQTSQVHLRIEVRRMTLTFELMTFSCYSGFVLYICHLKARGYCHTTRRYPSPIPFHHVCFTGIVSVSETSKGMAYRSAGNNVRKWKYGGEMQMSGNSWGGKLNLLSANTVNKHDGWKYVTHTWGQKKNKGTQNSPVRFEAVHFYLLSGWF